MNGKMDGANIIYKANARTRRRGSSLDIAAEKLSVSAIHDKHERMMASTQIDPTWISSFDSDVEE